MKVVSPPIALPFPAHLQEGVKTVDNTPGVYIFFDKQDYPLYIGKSTTVRARILSHFREFNRTPRKTKLLLQTAAIRHYPTAGEFTALFKEAELIKQYLPLHNKLLRKTKAYSTMKITPAGKVEFSQGIDLNDLPNHYGVFSNIRTAKAKLIELTECTSVCKQLCGLSSTAPCFSHQLNRCQRACGTPDFKQRHRQMLETHLAALRLKQWPYPGQALAVKETHTATGKAQYIVLYQWCYLGIADTLEDVGRLLQHTPSRKFDKNYYSLSVALLHSNKDGIELVPMSVQSHNL